MKPEDVPQSIWDAADHLIIALEEHVDFSNDGRIQQDRMDDQYARTQAVIARAIMAAKEEEREYAGELRGILGEILVVLRKEAPGTPLNNHKYDHLGIRAYDAILLIPYQDAGILWRTRYRFPQLAYIIRLHSCSPLEWR